jgi:hypothetical protein
MYLCAPWQLLSFYADAGTSRMLDCGFGWRVQPHWDLQVPILPSMHALYYECVIVLTHSYRNLDAVGLDVDEGI